MNDSPRAARREDSPGRTLLGRVVGYVDARERRRLVIVALVPLASWQVIEWGANLGFAPLLAAVALGAYLYSRRTGRGTLAGAAGGVGLLLIAVALFQVVQSVAGGSTEALPTTLARLSGWYLGGGTLLAFGIWVSRTDR